MRKQICRIAVGAAACFGAASAETHGPTHYSFLQGIGGDGAHFVSFAPHGLDFDEPLGEGHPEYARTVAMAQAAEVIVRSDERHGDVCTITIHDAPRQGGAEVKMVVASEQARDLISIWTTILGEAVIVDAQTKAKEHVRLPSFSCLYR